MYSWKAIANGQVNVFLFRVLWKEVKCKQIGIDVVGAQLTGLHSVGGNTENKCQPRTRVCILSYDMSATGYFLTIKCASRWMKNAQRGPASCTSLDKMTFSGFFLTVYIYAQIMKRSSTILFQRHVTGCRTNLSALHFVSPVTVHKPDSAQYGSEHPKWWFHLHEPLQQRACAEQCDRSITLRSAQLHLRGPVAISRHPLQHRLRWTPHLRRVLPAVQHSQISHLDGRSTITVSLLTTAYNQRHFLSGAAG